MNSAQRLLAIFSYVLPVVIGIAVAYLVYFFEVNRCIDVFHFYVANLRSSLFTGFLTMGGFLLSLKTGILIKIKENLYDSKKYEESFDELKKLNPNITRYGPLRRLSRFLLIAVLACLLASASQLTVGLFQSWVSVAICLGLAGSAMAYLFFVFLIMQNNLHNWFDFLEKTK